jgi:RNA recognition motif-containing protein
MNIYVGNLSYSVTEDDLRQAFEVFGDVKTTKVLRVKDTYTGRSKGFGFVEMPNEPEAQSAIDGLKAKDLKGRKISVSEARPRSEGRRNRGNRRGGRREGARRLY